MGLWGIISFYIYTELFKGNVLYLGIKLTDAGKNNSTSSGIRNG